MKKLVYSIGVIGFLVSCGGPAEETTTTETKDTTNTEQVKRLNDKEASQVRLEIDSQNIFKWTNKYIPNINIVEESEIKLALRLVYERMKIVVEPSCVVPLAAILMNKSVFKGKRVGLILTGGNVDLAKFADWFKV